MEPQVLTLAGLWNSGPLHWQTQWEAKHPGWLRVPHRDWDTPDCAEWVAELDAAIAACAQPPVLAAHSLSCSLVTRWAASGSRARVAGAFLVGPSDVDAPSYPDCTTGFQPMQLAPLPFPSLVVASTDDPYVRIERAQQFAAAWGSRLVTIGDAGHINGDAGYGPWPEGEQLLLDFCAQLQR
ncbi:RBBP9/YdeN family alpha/beta hydrolase [Rugamonas apoptosis]|uniref:Alpha/beta hydrolase n=1 Tax=Rugamonas apoptosis TaxID=2758570 RepID=A0A7W2IJT4_9BURK|nr:alpha/beta hydrolase [Rugamonas apoptosis]MBA5687105.1 alpha/beta hydrolase [Rugamonas apoptosis]